LQYLISPVGADCFKFSTRLLLLLLPPPLSPAPLSAVCYLQYGSAEAAEKAMEDHKDKSKKSELQTVSNDGL
jgi:hypothetical protein